MKRRIGLYMSAPILGGAEMHFKNLLWKIDRERYEVTLFFDGWDRFEEFLDLDNCPPHHVCRVALIEPGNRFGARALAASPQNGIAKGLPSNLRRWATRSGTGVTLLKKAVLLARRYVFMGPNFFRLFRAFEEHPVDLLHVVNGGYPGAATAQLAAIASKRAGCGVCIMSVCNTPMAPSFPRAAERLLDRAICASVERVLAPASNLGEAIVERMGISPEKIEVIPYGVIDPSTLANCSTDNAPGRSAGAGSGTVVTMAASFLPHKGHVHVLNVFRRLADSFPAARLVLIGDGPTKATMESLAIAMGLSERVTFTGFIPLDETLRIMKDSDILVHPSTLEGVPYVILHAMSLAKPVISSVVGGIGEIIVSGQTGLLIPPSDPVALEDALRSLLGNPEFRLELGRNGRRRYEQLFTVERMVERHNDLYQALFSQMQSPAAETN